MLILLAILAITIVVLLFIFKLAKMFINRQKIRTMSRGERMMMQTIKHHSEEGIVGDDAPPAIDPLPLPEDIVPPLINPGVLINPVVSTPRRTPRAQRRLNYKE